MLKIRFNLRKVIVIAICFAGSATMFAQETGVEINGVIWATRNVGAPGTFAAKPEDPGMFYQWNRKTAWPATGSVTGWDGTPSFSVKWEKVNDPCPTNWRVPTNDELISLAKASSVWTTNGRLFGSGGNTIFLPAAGLRSGSSGILQNVNYWGQYWSGTGAGTGTYRMEFNSTNVTSNDYIITTYGFCVRCVKDGSTGINEVPADTETATVTGYFDLLGKKLKEEPKEGAYIILYDNGKTRKVMN